MGGEGSGINTHNNIQDYGGGVDFTTGGWYSNILTQIPSQVKGKGWIYNVKVCILCYVMYMLAINLTQAMLIL